MKPAGRIATTVTSGLSSETESSDRESDLEKLERIFGDRSENNRPSEPNTSLMTWTNKELIRWSSFKPVCHTPPFGRRHRNPTNRRRVC
jgi:hypothetical protein